MVFQSITQGSASHKNTTEHYDGVTVTSGVMFDEPTKWVNWISIAIQAIIIP